MTHHCDFDHRHDLSTLDRQGGEAKDVLGPGICDYFRHAPRLVSLDCPGYLCYRNDGHNHVVARFARLVLSLSDTSQLRIGKHAVRYLAVSCGAITAM